MEYIITFTWDDEASVWIATSKDIPGPILESGSFDACWSAHALRFLSFLR